LRKGGTGSGVQGCGILTIVMEMAIDFARHGAADAADRLEIGEPGLANGTR
jgi:hypothetical protein